MGSFCSAFPFRECPVGARVHGKKQIVAPELTFWKISREVRVSPLQRLSAGPAGIQVVPRILFALKSYDFGAFFISVLKIKTQTKEKIKMARELPKVYEPQQVENEIYKMWGR